MKKEFVIQSIINRIQARTYLEIGVQRGKNFLQINAPFKIAIDPHFKIGTARRFFRLGSYLKSEFFEMTSDSFFEVKADTVLKKKRIDVAFIDGLHTYRQSLRDFNNCVKYISNGGVILLHDCNPTSREAASFAFSPEEMQKKFPGKNAEWNGDVWKTIVHLRSLHPELNVLVLDCDYGLAIVKKGKPEDPLHFSEQEIENLTYDDLEKNRIKFLNLKPEEYLQEFILSLK
jgi:hypothetical protein